MTKEKKKNIRRRWVKTTAILFGGLFLGLVGVDILFRSLPVAECSEEKSGKAEIKCPFLAFAKPSIENRSAFVNDVEKFGMDRTMAQFVALQVGWQQKGLWSILRGEAPDIYSLESVHGVSHCDLYSSYLPELEQEARSLEVNGQITLQDLVQMKKWVAQQLQVEVVESSQIETALLFVKAGGDLETQKVYTEDVFTLLKGQRPGRDALINADLLRKARELSNWD